MTAPLTDEQIAELIKRLRGRKDFGLFGSRGMMLTTPDKDCVAAAIELERLRAQPSYEDGLRAAAKVAETHGYPAGLKVAQSILALIKVNP